MAFEIPEHFHKEFTTNVELLLQEKTPVMMANTIMQAYSGEAAQVVKQFGEVEFAEKTSRNSDTVFSEIEHKQRWIFPKDYVLALPVDKEDELRMLNSPLSSYAEAMRAAWARKVNARIRDALLGTSKTGTNGGTSTVFDTSNQRILVNSSGLTITKLRTAKEKLRAAFVEPTDSLAIAVTAKQVTDMLETTEITSSDYNTIKALVQGDVDSFMGFHFIPYESLGVDGSSDRRVIAWAKSGSVLGQWNGLTTRIDERKDKNYTVQVHMSGTIGATRTQEAKVIEILCAE